MMSTHLEKLPPPPRSRRPLYSILSPSFLFCLA